MRRMLLVLPFLSVAVLACGGVQKEVMERDKKVSLQERGEKADKEGKEEKNPADLPKVCKELTDIVCREVYICYKRNNLKLQSDCRLEVVKKLMEIIEKYKEEIITNKEKDEKILEKCMKLKEAFSSAKCSEIVEFFNIPVPIKS